jgi:large subunit ribosomal protein L18
MNNKKAKTNRERRKARIRSKISGTAEKPRFSVFKSNMFLYAQVIDDDKGVTLASAKGKSAEEVGTKIAEAASGKKIKNVVFDRGGYIYQGKVKELAEAARKAGLKF